MTTPVIHLLTRVYVGLAVCAAVASAWVMSGAGASWLWIIFWLLTIAVASTTPRYPAAGLGAYAAAHYGTPRYSDLFDVLARANLLHLLAAFAAAGVVLWLAREQRQPRLKGTLITLVILFFGWILIANLIAPVVDSRLDVRHDPLFFVHALVLLVAAAQVMDTPGALRTFTGIVVCALAVRIGWQGVQGLNLENDIGPLVLMMLPLCAALIQTDDHPAIKLGMLLAALGGLAATALTFNRASAVALVAVLLFGVWRYRRQVWILATIAICLAAAVAWFAASGYRARFEQALVEIRGMGTGSVSERFKLWDAGLAIAKAHPVAGVGIGNYPVYLERYAPGHGDLPAHNSFVQIAAEAGFAGLALYAALFLTALIVSGAASRRGPPTGAIAAGLQLSLVAYLTASLFLSRHDMVLAYIIVGWVAAVADATTNQRARPLP